MKIKFVKYCVAEIEDQVAQYLIDKGLAIEVCKMSCSENGQDVLCKNKMVNVVYVQHGHPKKEV